MRGHIDVDLSPDDALALVETQFPAKQGWQLRRSERGLLVEPTAARGMLFEPDPGGQAPLLPETLALRVDAEPLATGGTRIVARVTRTRVGVVLAMVGGDLLTSFGLGVVLHLGQMVEYRRERSGAKRKLVRQAIEPLMPHQLEHDAGPFRRGHAG